MKERLEKVEEDIKDLLPIVKIVKVKMARKPVTKGYVKSALEEAGLRATTYKEAMTFFESYLNDVDFNVSKLSNAIVSKDIDISNPRVEEIVSNAIDTYTTVYMGISDIITNIFNEEELPPAKKSQLIQESRFVGGLYNHIAKEDVVKEVKNVPLDVPAGALKGFLKSDSFIFLSNFNGNPFFIIGKWLNRRDKKRVELLKARVEYVKLEVLEMEMSGDTSKEHKKHIQYYKDLIHELEVEIASLRND